MPQSEMKRPRSLLLICLLTLLSGILGSASASATEYLQSVPAAIPAVRRSIQHPPRRSFQQPPKKALKQTQSGHWNISTYYSMASEIHYKGQVNLFGTPTDYTAIESSSAVPGIAGGYLWRRPWSVGFDSGLSYDLPRTLNSISGLAGAYKISGDWQDNPKLGLITAALNGNFMLGRAVFIYAGINYPLAFSGGSETELSGLPGYQLGTGASFLDHWAIDASYRTIHMKGRFSSGSLSLQVDQADISGFVFTLSYLF
jgi:hypothetical protein